MKNRMFVGLVAAATALVLSSSLAAAEDFAYSANAIGVIKKTIPAGKMALIAIPLDLPGMASDGTIDFLDLPFLDTFPQKSTANLWDVENQTWCSGSRSRSSWIGDITNCYLLPGQAIFFKNGGSSSIEVVISGNVPSVPSVSIDTVPAACLQGCANPYPVPFVFGESGLATNATSGATVNFWDTENGEWISGSKPRSTWTENVATNVVSPGEGFLYKAGKTGSAGHWEVSKPYVWPGND